MHHSISQIKTNLMQHCAGFISAVTLHVSGASAPHQEYLFALIRWRDDLPATITHVPVAAVPVLNTPDDGRLRPKHVEWLYRNKTRTVLHQVGFYLTSEILKTALVFYLVFAKKRNESLFLVANISACNVTLFCVQHINGELRFHTTELNV